MTNEGRPRGKWRLDDHFKVVHRSEGFWRSADASLRNSTVSTYIFKQNPVEIMLVAIMGPRKSYLHYCSSRTERRSHTNHPVPTRSADSDYTESWTSLIRVSSLPIFHETEHRLPRPLIPHLNPRDVWHLQCDVAIDGPSRDRVRVAQVSEAEKRLPRLHLANSAPMRHVQVVASDVIVVTSSSAVYQAGRPNRDGESAYYALLWKFGGDGDVIFRNQFSSLDHQVGAFKKGRKTARSIPCNIFSFFISSWSSNAKYRPEPL